MQHGDFATIAFVVSIVSRLRRRRDRRAPMRDPLALVDECLDPRGGPTRENRSGPGVPTHRRAASNREWHSRLSRRCAESPCGRRSRAAGASGAAMARKFGSMRGPAQQGLEIEHHLGNPFRDRVARRHGQRREVATSVPIVDKSLRGVLVAADADVALHALGERRAGSRGPHRRPRGGAGR